MIDRLISESITIHQEHRDWLMQLNFYQDEIKFFQNELVIVHHKHFGSISMLGTIEEYQQIFLKKLQHIDALRHSIALHEKKLSKILAPTNSDLQQHKEVQERFETFVKDFELMKKNFKRFSAHND